MTNRCTLIAGLALAAGLLWYLVDGRYSYTTTKYAGLTTIRTDRLTGAVQYCNNTGCR